MQINKVVLWRLTRQTTRATVEDNCERGDFGLTQVERVNLGRIRHRRYVLVIDVLGFRHEHTLNKIPAP